MTLIRKLWRRVKDPPPIEWDQEPDPAEWERRIAQPLVRERYRAAALRMRERSIDREVAEAIAEAEACINGR